MNNTNKVFKISIGLIVIGLILSIVGYLMGGKTQLGLTKSGIKVLSDEQVTINKELNPFTQIEINLDYYNQIEIITADTFKIEATYNVGVNEFTYEVKDQVLKINQNPSSTFSILNLDFSTALSHLKVYVPNNTELHSIQIQTQNSKVELSDLNIDDLLIKNDYGKNTLTNIEANQINLISSSATVELENIQTIHLELENDYGQNNFKDIKATTLKLKGNSSNMEMRQLNAHKLEINNDYGDVKIKNMKVENLIASLQSGDLSIENGEVDCTTIDNKYGSIELNYKGNLSDYSYEILNKYGTTTLKHNQDGHVSKISNDGNLIYSIESDKNINISGESSSIKVSIFQ